MANEIEQARGGNPTSDDWMWWVNRWNRFSAMDFLTSSYEAIIEKLKISTQTNEELKLEEQLKPLKELLPWPIQAINGYLAYNYTLGLNLSIVELLRDRLGQWWSSHMHTLKGGLSTLPWAFTKNKGGVELGNVIDFGMFVTKVTYTDPEETRVYPTVSVRARNDKFQQRDQNIVGDVCIVTLPLNIIRQVPFDPPLKPDFADALMHINYCPSTKILLQCKTRFWEKDHSIFGGFSFTNLPIGQLHYPTNADKIPKDDRGILMCYTWKQEGLLFGSQPEQMAIAEAVEEISFIHPKIKDNFEVGAVQAWYSDPASQGAFAMLRPFEIQLINNYLLYPYPKPKKRAVRPPPPPPPLYFAGEAISYTHGWIQGALESGLRAAYQFYSRNENFHQAK